MTVEMSKQMTKQSVKKMVGVGGGGELLVTSYYSIL